MASWCCLTKLQLFVLVLRASTFQAFICKFNLRFPASLCILSMVSNFLHSCNSPKLSLLQSLEINQLVNSMNCFLISSPCYLRVICKCGLCGTKKQALSEWERHTNSKLRNWRTSIRVKGSMLPLEKWVCA